MTEKMSYCDIWFRSKKTSVGPISEDEARKRHVSGSHYVALIGPPEKPYYFIDIVPPFFGVGFLDDNLREYLSYHFDKSSRPGDIFLSMATFREYKGITDEIEKATTYYFYESGIAHIKETDFTKNEIYEYDTEYDPEPNYEPQPLFGRYNGILKEER